MRIAIFSDIHSNLPALTQALAIVQAQGAEQVYCLGDTVGYGGSPNECLDLIRERAAICVLGNHDMAALDPVYADFFSRPGRIAAEWTHKVLTKENRDFLASLPYQTATDQCTLVHASPLNPEQWQYVLSLQIAKQQFAAFSTPLCFVGHTHVPAICSEDLKTFTFKKGKRLLINVGSIGQPRDGNPQLSFGMLDTEAWTYQNVRSAYDIDAASEIIRRHGLPSTLATRLYQGV